MSGAGYGNPSRALSTTLTMLATALHDAREPWWIIGGAAIALHGADVVVGDVDVLVGIADGRMLADRLGLVADPGPASPLFRSALFALWEAPPLTVEIMAGFHVRTELGWQLVAPKTRQAARVGDHTVFVPDRKTLRAMLALFGRPKDRARMALLAA